MILLGGFLQKALHCVQYAPKGTIRNMQYTFIRISRYHPEYVKMFVLVFAAFYNLRVHCCACHPCHPQG